MTDRRRVEKEIIDEPNREERNGKRERAHFVFEERVVRPWSDVTHSKKEKGKRQEEK